MQAAEPPASAQDPEKKTVQWSDADMAGIWDFTIGEGDDAFATTMVLEFKEKALSGNVNLGGPMEMANLAWNQADAALTFVVEFGPDMAIDFALKREGDALVGTLTANEPPAEEGGESEQMVENITAVKNLEKSKAAAERAARIARGEVVDGVEVGDHAPEIEGIDLDGVEFKLSDYAGKVVMLDFWGDW